jgi:hypothetical protein
MLNGAAMRNIAVANGRKNPVISSDILSRVRAESIIAGARRATTATRMRSPALAARRG